MPLPRAEPNKSFFPQLREEPPHRSPQHILKLNKWFVEPWRAPLSISLDDQKRLLSSPELKPNKRLFPQLQEEPTPPTQPAHSETQNVSSSSLQMLHYRSIWTTRKAFCSSPEPNPIRVSSLSFFFGGGRLTEHSARGAPTNHRNGYPHTPCQRSEVVRRAFKGFSERQFPQLRKRSPHRTQRPNQPSLEFEMPSSSLGSASLSISLDD
mmetsp:Transcript_9881/g.17208  ORF Transcript_9881/g.17208 Transcript_9881/m.17208 type:complete len:209 (-) Transcript_9881:175-801(-)